ncbi:LysR family transcriptional regulator [Myxococcota bacterium]|nr:LysR family transcriptional regulator [Myxococcota bacterium]
MESERLTAFRAVARSLSFSRAAEQLHKTQPAISQSVRALETSLGERLFLRLGRRIQLTLAGRILLEHVEESFAALERGRLRIEALAELREGELRIGASDTTACYVLPPVLQAYRERYPDVDVWISNRPSPKTLEQLTASEVDIGFVTLPVAQPDLTVEPLLVREDVAICAPNHELAARSRVTLDQLLPFPLLLLDRGSSTRTFIDQRIAAAGTEPQIAMEVGSIEIIKHLVQRNFGVSIVPRAAVETEVANERLHALRIFSRADQRQLGVAYSNRQPPCLAATAFLRMTRALVRDTSIQAPDLKIAPKEEGRLNTGAP